MACRGVIAEHAEGTGEQAEGRGRTDLGWHITCNVQSRGEITVKRGGRLSGEQERG